MPTTVVKQLAPRGAGLGAPGAALEQAVDSKPAIPQPKKPKGGKIG
ncbi:MAG: hypothetical protein ACUVXG_13955 [Anaerolineae bacterium]